MLQVARLAHKLLGESAVLVTSFLHSQMNDDGGFKDRGGASDLYYSVFGLEGLLALRADLPAGKVEKYLRSFADVNSLDFIHASCLARCWAALPPDLRQAAPRDAILARIESFRSADGTYNAAAGSKAGNLYGCFIALGAYEDLGAQIPDPNAMLELVDRLRANDGGYSNQEDQPLGLTPSTAAAATLLRHLGQDVDPAVADWLLSRHHPEGGFFATPQAPIPDLLSTATALHALAGLHVDLEKIKEPCLDFIDTLWTSKGAFYGHWGDDIADCEYTYYALLALGHLSL
jgi:prenyltransferase beta subunit